MDKELFASDGSFLQHANLYELFEIARGGLASGNILFNQILNAAVRQIENQIDQLTAVDFRCCLLHINNRQS